MLKHSPLEKMYFKLWRKVLNVHQERHKGIHLLTFLPLQVRWIGFGHNRGKYKDTSWPSDYRLEKNLLARLNSLNGLDWCPSLSSKRLELKNNRRENIFLESSVIFWKKKYNQTFYGIKFCSRHVILTSLKLISNFLMINIAINNIFVNIIPSISWD